MIEPLDEVYFKWLYGQVSDLEITDPSLTHWKVLNHLYRTEFGREGDLLVPNDDNRLEDGKELRIAFLHDEGITSIDDVDPHWLELGCSVLELMVGLSKRMAFESIRGGEPHYWFWEIMGNIGLQRYNDEKVRLRYPKKRIEDILDKVIYRTYEEDGTGGFFPLQHPEENQQSVELWYQLSAYLNELNSN